MQEERKGQKQDASRGHADKEEGINAASGQAQAQAADRGTQQGLRRGSLEAFKKNGVNLIPSLKMLKLSKICLECTHVRNLRL